MTTLCRLCGFTESEAVANAKALGLEQELESGLYTCCQISEWAREQFMVWSEAASEDLESILVPVRLRRQQAG
jgi:hypothetical protein